MSTNVTCSPHLQYTSHGPVYRSSLQQKLVEISLLKKQQLGLVKNN